MFLNKLIKHKNQLGKRICLHFYFLAKEHCIMSSNVIVWRHQIEMHLFKTILKHLEELRSMAAIVYHIKM
jgi:hypothetical protein